jgi:hypothetical protein
LLRRGWRKLRGSVGLYRWYVAQPRRVSVEDRSSSYSSPPFDNISELERLISRSQQTPLPL